MKSSIRLLALVLMSTSFLCAESVWFPADSGIVDVTKPPYNAVGDGKADCTAAIQRAMDDHPARRAIIFLPNGTYLISDTIKWPAGSGGNTFKRTTLQGESEAGTVLKLIDGAPGFDDATRPKAMAYTGPKPAQRFGNEIRNITFDVGGNNSGLGSAIQHIEPGLDAQRHDPHRRQGSDRPGHEVHGGDRTVPAARHHDSGL